MYHFFFLPQIFFPFPKFVICWLHIGQRKPFVSKQLFWWRSKNHNKTPPNSEKNDLVKCKVFPSNKSGLVKCNVFVSRRKSLITYLGVKSYLKVFLIKMFFDWFWSVAMAMKWPADAFKAIFNHDLNTNVYISFQNLT